MKLDISTIKEETTQIYLDRAKSKDVHGTDHDTKLALAMYSEENQ